MNTDWFNRYTLGRPMEDERGDQRWWIEDTITGDMVGQSYASREEALDAIEPAYEALRRHEESLEGGSDVP